MTVRGYTVAVDWSGRGTFDQANEDVSSYVSDGDITMTYGRDLSDATLASTTSQFSFNLRNDDRRFSPESTSSPIAGKVIAGKTVKVTHLYAPTGAVSVLAAGPLDAVTVDPNAVDYQLTGAVLDPWNNPGGIKLSTPVYQGLRTGDLVNVILDAIGWTGGRDLDDGATVVPYWWEEGTDAATAVTKLVNSEGHPSIAYVKAGTFVFRDRHWRITSARCLTSQGLFTHIYPAGTGPGGDFKIETGSFTYDHGLTYVANYASQDVDIRRPVDYTTVWSTDDAVALAAGQSLAITANPSDPFINALTPVVGTDIIVASGTVSASLSRTSGATTTIFLTCTADAVITHIGLSAVPVSVARTITVTAQNQASINKYGGVRQWSGSIPWGSPDDAQAILNKVVAVYGDNVPTIEFTISDQVNSTYLPMILGLEIGDRITIRNDIVGTNADYIVERLTRIVSSLTVHRLTVGARPADPVQPSNIFTFDVAGKGFNQGAFGTDGIDSPSTVFRFDVAGQGFDQGVFAS